MTTPSPRPIITLTTDFGTQDGYVGAMKGVLSSMCPEAVLVDITHDIPAQDIVHAALALQRATPWFPPGTIHMVVVDPGVGTQRHPIGAKIGPHFFIAPDNGVLSRVAERVETSTLQMHVLDVDLLALPRLSSTFHGRDLFSPAAARLALGHALDTLGPKLDTMELLPIEAPVVHSPTHITGSMLSIDHFGNIVTTITRAQLQHLDAFTVTLCEGTCIYSVRGPYSTYAEAPKDTPVALFGADDFLEISVNQGSAADTLGFQRALRVSIEVRA